MKRLYVAFCRRWGPDGLTFSAYAWKRSKAGRDGWRIRIDGLFMLVSGQQGHCQQQFQRETRGD